MWVRVTRSDDQKQLVFGTLDNEPLNDYRGEVALNSEFAASYSRIRDHKKPTEFTKQRGKSQDWRSALNPRPPRLGLGERPLRKALPPLSRLLWEEVVPQTYR